MPEPSASSVPGRPARPGIAFLYLVTTSTTPAEPTDGELLQRLRAGDERALEIVFRAHYSGMASFVQRFVRSPDVAEELVQDLFLKLWTKREQLS